MGKITEKKKFYNLTEVAALLEVSKAYITKMLPGWVEDGRVKIVRIGRIVRVSADEVQRLIDSYTIG